MAAGGRTGRPRGGGPAGAFTLEEYTFEDPARAAEFRKLIEELRCLVCQNENLAASQAELAQDLRTRSTACCSRESHARRS
jgi:cytochrome c-type biogenesis protein CcmH/NrfF